METCGGFSSDAPAVFVDLGTTNTRVWLARGPEVLARAKAQVGVRDTARDGSNARLRETLRSRIAEVVAQNTGAAPTAVVAAGMITSALGLAEVPHVPAPAGVAELAAGTRRFEFPDITPLPIFLVPGVRTGSLADPRDTSSADIMRGEETLCVGLIAQKLISAPATVINLGSHWKAIHIDDQGRVAGSVTSLAGEMIHAVQSTTILASALPAERPDTLEREWVESGMAEQRAHGLPRALFRVRLLELSKATTPAERLAFLVGAFIACDLDALMDRQVIRQEARVALVGAGSLTTAWDEALMAASVPSVSITEEQTESALLAGLRTIQAAR